ncbi:hypothetical protein [Arthrobacter humicola]
MEQALDAVLQGGDFFGVEEVGHLSRRPANGRPALASALASVFER